MDVPEAQLDVISRLMTAAATRHRVIGSNIANANTPKYRTREVSFEDELSRLIAKEDLQPEDLETTVRHTVGLPTRNDGNNVDVAREMGQLEKNALIYSAYSNIMALRINMLKSSITGQ